MCVIYSIIPTAVLRAKNIILNGLFRLNRKNGDKTIFLTFDDGPDKNFTPELLDLLMKNEIKATFFIVSDFAEKNPKIIERMKAEGHYIALHSYKHKSPLFESPGETKEAFGNSVKVMEDLGCSPQIMRPAWGSFNLVLLKLIRERNIRIVLWTVMAEDWRGNITSEEIARRLRRRTRPGSIICLHDGRGENSAPARTIAALKQVIPEWKRLGYSFKTIEENKIWV